VFQFLLLSISSLDLLGMQERKSGQDTTVEISAREQWYLDRAEKEQFFQGTLGQRKAQIGPGARGGVNFTLLSKDAEYPIYTGGADEKLQPFAGRTVRLRAKLVDLAKEGFGKELWVGSLRVMSHP
jgi:hypothetical protein